MSADLRRTILHRALHRPNLLMGCERDLAMLAICLSGGLVLAGQNLPALILGVAIWVAAFSLLRRMSRVDPYLSAVYRRQLRYTAYYPARSRPFQKD